MDVCETCIEISKRDPYRTWDGKKSAKTIQCEECGNIWAVSWTPRTISFRKNRAGEWIKCNWSWGFRHYAPVECTQRRCSGHARHKVASRGKRKYKCDHHAGVCIIA